MRRIKLKVSFMLLLLLNSSCAGASVSLETNSAYIEGRSIEGGEINIFDGSSLKKIAITNGKFRAPHNITPGYYGVIFYTKSGFLPYVRLFKVTDKPIVMVKPSLTRLKDKDIGVLAGIIYTPVTGGKIREHRGIFKVFGGKKIELLKDTISYPAITDKDGIFTIVLPPGEYKIVVEGKEVGKVSIEAGKTTIKNIQKGMVLID